MSYSELKQLIEEHQTLVGINRYNPNNLSEVLEMYVQAQVEENKYDLEANLTVLKLYQLNPEHYNPSITCQILLKALMRLPASDFLLAKALLDHERTLESSVQRVLELGAALEMCQFEAVWSRLDEIKQLTTINGFEESLREFVCHVIKISYQNIEFATLQRILGVEDDITHRILQQCAAKHEWTLPDKPEPKSTVHISNAEDRIKSRNISERIDFDNVRAILKGSAQR